MFERYLDERGYRWEHEPDHLGTIKNPDYIVHADGRTLACEVKAFNTEGALARKPGRGVAVGSRTMKEVLAPHRDDIKKAAAQLKELRDRGWPLIVVLSNPCGFAVPTHPRLVIAAMYGDPEMVAPWLPDDSLGDFTMVAGANGKLRNYHPYISAVAMLQIRPHARAWSAQWIADHRDEYPDRLALAAGLLEVAPTQAPKGDDVYLDVVETISATAAPLPRDIFDGPLDRRFAANDTPPPSLSDNAE